LQFSCNFIAIIINVNEILLAFCLRFIHLGNIVKRSKDISIILVLTKNMLLRAISIRQYFFMGIIAPNKKTANGNMTLKEICDMYLKYQHTKLQADNLTARHHNDQIGSLKKLKEFLGENCQIKSIKT